MLLSLSRKGCLQTCGHPCAKGAQEENTVRSTSLSTSGLESRVSGHATDNVLMLFPFKIWNLKRNCFSHCMSFVLQGRLSTVCCMPSQTLFGNHDLKRVGILSRRLSLLRLFRNWLCLSGLFLIKISTEVHQNVSHAEARNSNMHLRMAQDLNQHKLSSILLYGP